MYRWVLVNPNMDNLNSWIIQSHKEIAQLYISTILNTSLNLKFSLLIQKIVLLSLYISN